MDTSLPQNAPLIERIKHKALGSGLLEAFLESAPQLILQCSIILRTGNTSNYRGSISTARIAIAQKK
jgi:hypothetical protein